MPYIEARDGTELYVKMWGEGPPVVLVHGWPLSADSWDYQMHGLADAGFTAIAYDRRGFGRSEQTGDGYDYESLTDDLADVLEACEVTDNAFLVGFSMGGGEVVRYMRRNGNDGIAGIALISAVVPYLYQSSDSPEGVPKATLEQMKTQLMTDRGMFFATFFKQFYGDGLLTHPVSDEVMHWSRHTAMMAGVRGTLATLEAFGTTDFTADLAQITVPALLIHGTSDKTVPIDATARRAAAMLPDATLIEYDGEPHGILATQHQRVTNDLIDFCRRVTGSDTGPSQDDLESEVSLPDFIRAPH
jgi:non-heme chloroperoxidase